MSKPVHRLCVPEFLQRSRNGFVEWGDAGNTSTCLLGAADLNSMRAGVHSHLLNHTGAAAARRRARLAARRPARPVVL